MLLDIFLLLAIIASILSVISFLKQFQMRIFTSIGAAVIWFVLALGPLNITFFQPPSDVFIQTANITNSTIGGTSGEINWQNDNPIAWLFIGLAIIMLIRTVQLILEVLTETGEKARESRPFESKLQDDFVIVDSDNI